MTCHIVFQWYDKVELELDSDMCDTNSKDAKATVGWMNTKWTETRAMYVRSVCWLKSIHNLYGG